MFNERVISKMISVTLLLDPGLRLALSEGKQWQGCIWSKEAFRGLIKTLL